MTDKDKNIEKEIDLSELGLKIWDKRSLVIKISLLGFIIGIIVALSIPKEYVSTIALAPEAKPSSPMGNMGALAAMAGVNLNQSSDDAISPELYPNIMNSTPFLIGLLDIEVRDKKKEIQTNLFNYLDKEQSIAWWNYILAIPAKIRGGVSRNEVIVQESLDLNNIERRRIELSPKQNAIIENLKARINVSVDKKTGIITLSSMMQSPEISAYIADTVTSYLQNYIIKYRTQKARKDLAFSQKLYQEAQENYYKAQQEYNIYIDKNLDIVSARYGATKERLQNEVTLTYGVYNQMAQQLQMAKVKVQDTTPVYTIIQPAIVPLIPDKPKKKLIVIGFVFTAFIGAVTGILTREFLKNSFNIK